MIKTLALTMAMFLAAAAAHATTLVTWEIQDGAIIFDDDDFLQPSPSNPISGASLTGTFVVDLNGDANAVFQDIDLSVSGLTGELSYFNGTYDTLTGDPTVPWFIQSAVGDDNGSPSLVLSLDTVQIDILTTIGDTLGLQQLIFDDNFLFSNLAGCRDNGCTIATAEATITATAEIIAVTSMAPVPLPASAWLLLGAFGGLAAFRRRAA